VTDAVGGTSLQAHQAGLDRIAQAGGQPTSVAQVGCELQRDWARQETAEGFTQVLFGGDPPLAGSRIHIVRRDECRPRTRPVRPWATRLTHPRPTAPTRATRGIKAVIPVKEDQEDHLRDLP
jgi:hypothetical protein